jgi:hypothetical protein
VSGGPEFAQAMDLLVAKYPQYRTLGFEREGGHGDPRPRPSAGWPGANA